MRKKFKSFPFFSFVGFVPLCLISLCSCKSNALTQYYGTYYLVSDFFDGEEQCSLTINKDNTFQIVYRNETHNGTYMSREVDNQTGFLSRSGIIVDEWIPNKNEVSSYYLHLKTIDNYDSLPDVLIKFFNNNFYNYQQYLYIHTFATKTSFDKFGLTKRNMIEKTDDSHIYKEIYYFRNANPIYNSDGTEVPFEERIANDPPFGFVQVTNR